MEKGWNPNVEISPTCPRCGSSNTKFCYYNNYSLTQPRYFCKGCRRYWTKGGSLRNVPVGGGCRKSRRGKPFRASSIVANGRNPSRGFAGGPAALGHNGTAPILSNGSLAGAEGSNIDLGLVYPNFLGQKPGPEAEPEPDNQLDFLTLPSSVGGPSFYQFSSVESIHMGLIANQLSQESGFVEYRSLSDRSLDTHFSDGDAFYFSGLESFDKQQATDYQLSSTTMNQINSYMLPPLPGEELAVSEGTVWSGSDRIMFPSHALHAKQFSGSEPQAQEPNQLDKNGSQFNASIELCNVFRP